MIENKLYLIDLDGTMYHGKKIIKEAKIFIDYLIDNNFRFIFLTNNSSRTQKQCVEHMEKMGYKNLKPEMFYTSAMAAVDYISTTYPDKKRAAYIGENGLKQPLISNNYIFDFENPDFLFVGMDRNATYTDYSFALRTILNGATFVATNDDRILLTENGPNIGNGSVVALLEYASGVKPIRIGKPHKIIVEKALKYAKTTKEDAIIVGDNLETDILAGINAGLESILVTSGVHSMEDAFRLNIKPTYIVDSLDHLII